MPLPWAFHLCFQMQWLQFTPCLTEESFGTSNCSFHQCTGRGSQWGCSHLEIRLDKSGCNLHSCDRQFGYLLLFDSVEQIQAKQERCKNWALWDSACHGRPLGLKRKIWYWSIVAQYGVIKIALFQKGLNNCSFQGLWKSPWKKWGIHHF